MNKLIKTFSIALLFLPIIAYSMEDLYTKIDADNERVRVILSNREKAAQEVSRIYDEMIKLQHEQIKIHREQIDLINKRMVERKKLIMDLSKPEVIDREEQMPIDNFISDCESESEVLFLNEQNKPVVLAGPTSGFELISPFHPENDFSNFFAETSDEGTDLVEVSMSGYDSDALEYSSNIASLKELLKNSEYIEMSVDMSKKLEKKPKESDNSLIVGTIIYGSAILAHYLYPGIFQG